MTDTPGFQKKQSEKDAVRVKKIPWTTAFFQKYKIETILNLLKNMNGDPHYVAMGMAIGVFMGITPTIPLNTLLALAAAFLLKGSKPAAMIGVWIGNPITIPFIYIGSYKIGAFCLGYEMVFNYQSDSILELAKVGMDITVALLLGGVILGILPAVISYFVTRDIMVTYGRKKAEKHSEKHQGDSR